MGLYDRFILPPIVHHVCSRSSAMRQRAKIVPAAAGRVLEIGFGSGLNLPYYDPATVTHLWALDPSERMWDLARENVRRAPFPVEFVNARAEELPLENHSADTILLTYTLCTVREVPSALREIQRVLEPGGVLLFCEHGAAPDETTRRWQRRLNAGWTRLSGGCNLTRPIPALLEEGGFRIRELSAMYVPGWRPASFNYWGSAVPAGQDRFTTIS